MKAGDFGFAQEDILGGKKSASMARDEVANFLRAALVALTPVRAVRFS